MTTQPQTATIVVSDVPGTNNITVEVTFDPEIDNGPQDSRAVAAAAMFMDMLTQHTSPTQSLS